MPATADGPGSPASTATATASAAAAAPFKPSDWRGRGQAITMLRSRVRALERQVALLGGEHAVLATTVSAASAAGAATSPPRVARHLSAFPGDSTSSGSPITGVGPTDSALGLGLGSPTPPSSPRTRPAAGSVDDGTFLTAGVGAAGGSGDGEAATSGEGAGAAAPLTHATSTRPTAAVPPARGVLLAGGSLTAASSTLAASTRLSAGLSSVTSNAVPGNAILPAPVTSQDERAAAHVKGLETRNATRVRELMAALEAVSEPLPWWERPLRPERLLLQPHCLCRPRRRRKRSVPRLRRRRHDRQCWRATTASTSLTLPHCWRRRRRTIG